jgi:hypothetical protein
LGINLAGPGGFPDYGDGIWRNNGIKTAAHDDARLADQPGVDRG